MTLDIKRERHGIVTIALDAHEVMVVRSACEQLGELFDSRDDGVEQAEIIPGVLDPFGDDRQVVSVT